MASSRLCLLALTVVVGLGGSIFAATTPARPVSPLAPGAGELRGMLILNEDNSHFFSSRPPEAMTREGLHALVDGYAGSAVTHLFLSPNSMRASFRIACSRETLRLGENELIVRQRGDGPSQQIVWIEIHFD